MQIQCNNGEWQKNSKRFFDKFFFEQFSFEDFEDMVFSCRSEQELKELDMAFLVDRVYGGVLDERQSLALKCLITNIATNFIK